jgi:Rieske Fe-S protein
MPIRWSAGSRERDRMVRFPLPDADGAQIDRDNELILVRWQQSIYAFALSCPHQRTMLKWIAKDARFQCPKHKSKYQPDGVFISGRATRGMDRYPVRIAGTSVIVDTSALIRQDEDEAGWSAAMARLR